MRHALIALGMMLCTATSAFAELNVSIGINLPSYPRLVRVPNYPVYYAPGLDSNYFFYDGLYWVYSDDNWYSSPWYNGPWRIVDPFSVPLYVLRVPVRYYRHAPVYFRGWRADAPPRWGDHWGSTWEQRRSGWSTWNRSSAPAPAPLPTYQQRYSGSRYPSQAEQTTIYTQNYRYQPRDAIVQQQYQQHNLPVAPAKPVVQPAAPQPAPRQRTERAAPQPQAQPQAQSRTQPQPQARPQQGTAQPATKAEAPQRFQQPAKPQPQAQPQAQSRTQPQPQAKPQQGAAQPAKAEAPQRFQPPAPKENKGKGPDKEKDKDDKGKGKDR